MVSPQVSHMKTRSESCKLGCRHPQPEHVWEDGSHRETTSTRHPASRALYAICLRNSESPTSAMARDRCRFFNIPDTLRSSSTITAGRGSDGLFLATNPAVALCRAFWRTWAIRAYMRASRRWAFLRLAEPFCLRE